MDKFQFMKTIFFEKGLLVRTFCHLDNQCNVLWAAFCDSCNVFKWSRRAFWESKCEHCEICSFKNALLYSLIKCSYSKCPFKKGHLNKGILSRDIGGHFGKGKRAFPPNRQTPFLSREVAWIFLSREVAGFVCHKRLRDFFFSQEVVWVFVLRGCMSHWNVVPLSIYAFVLLSFCPFVPFVPLSICPFEPLSLSPFKLVSLVWDQAVITLFC